MLHTFLGVQNSHGSKQLRYKDSTPKLSTGYNLEVKVDLKKLFTSANISWLIAGEHKEKLLDIIVAPAAKSYPQSMTHPHSSIHNAASTYFSSAWLWEKHMQLHAAEQNQITT